MLELHELSLTLLCCSKTETRHGGVFVALFAATAPDGTVGHLAYEYEWEKRDVMRESVYVSKDALRFECDNSPSDITVFGVRLNTGEEPTRHEAWSGCSIYTWGDH